MGYPVSLNDLADRAYAIAEANGFHADAVTFLGDPLKVLGRLMLIDTEVAEAAEAVRHGDWENFEEELADVCIRAFDLYTQLRKTIPDDGRAQGAGSLEQAIINKMERNRKRGHMHGGKTA